MINNPSLYTVSNWLTLGAVDTVKGAVQPEKPLSLQHWADSFATATMVMPLVSKGLTVYDGLKTPAASNRLVTPTEAHELLSGGACFVAGTAVLTSEGLKAIENLKAGDMVWAENPETGEKALKEVVQTFVRESDELVHIVVAGKQIITTPEHPFYVPQKGWTGAAQLRAGDILVLSNGKYVTLEKVRHELLESPVTVYNFEVADFHTYYVGELSVLVHNTCMRFTGDQQALLDIGKEAQLGARTGNFISFDDALTIDMWAKEYGIPQHHTALIGSGQHWTTGWDHTHLFGKHIPFK